MITSKKIAVIGAGLAGLTAAYRLTQNGFDVDVFEEKNRVGGRVFTVLMENYLDEITEVELGGQNITDGGKATHLLNLLEELNLTVQEKIINISLQVHANDQYQDFNALVQQHGKSIEELLQLSKCTDSIARLIELYCGGNALLREALTTRMTAYEGIDAAQQSIYHNIETLQCSLQGGVAKFHEVYEHQDNQVVTKTIKGGNALLPIELAKNLRDRVHYNKALGRVVMQAHSVQLTFKDQSVYEYDHVILAIPACTFNNIDLTESQIDPNKLQKIQSIGYGGNYKIAIAANLANRNGVRFLIKDNMISSYNHDDTILLLCVNDEVRNRAAFMDTLRDFYGIECHPSQLHFLDASEENYKLYKTSVQHNWKRNPYIKGSYAGYSASVAEELDMIESQDEVCYKSLFLPVNNRLFFAGEHTTILECIGTMEAAVESGQRMAKAVMKIKAGS